MNVHSGRVRQSASFHFPVLAKAAIPEFGVCTLLKLHT